MGWVRLKERLEEGEEGEEKKKIITKTPNINFIIIRLSSNKLRSLEKERERKRKRKRKREREVVKKGWG